MIHNNIWYDKAKLPHINTAVYATVLPWLKYKVINANSQTNPKSTYQISRKENRLESSTYLANTLRPRHPPPDNTPANNANAAPNTPSRKAEETNQPRKHTDE